MLPCSARRQFSCSLQGLLDISPGSCLLSTSDPNIEPALGQSPVQMSCIACWACRAWLVQWVV